MVVLGFEARIDQFPCSNMKGRVEGFNSPGFSVLYGTLVILVCIIMRVHLRRIRDYIHLYRSCVVHQL